MRYKNLTILVISLVILFLTADTSPVQSAIQTIGAWGYGGMFIAGMFFICSFTLAPAALVLYHFALTGSPYVIAIWAGAGAVVGDYTIFRFFRDGVFEELKPLFLKYGGERLSNLLRRPGYVWIAPVLGALIIASPFPDEIGIAMMGVSRVNSLQFILLSYVLNAAGIYAIVEVARNLAS